MIKKILLCFFITSFSYVQAKEENSLKEKLWQAVKDYIKETETYKYVDFGRKEIKKIKKKINKKIDMIKD